MDRPSPGDRSLSPPRTTYLVSCVAKKRPQACAAAALYVSPWFRRARSHVERSGAAWFILSARHGLLAPDAIIDP